MKKILILLILVVFVSCSKDNDIDCLSIKQEIHQKYFDLIKQEKLGTNNPKIIQILENERDRKLSLVCN